MFSFNSSTALLFVSAVLVKSILIFAATAAVLLALRRSSASNRALAWQMCLFAMLLLPLLSAALPSLTVAVPYRPKTSEAMRPNGQVQAPTIEKTALPIESGHDKSAAHESATAQPISPRLPAQIKSVVLSPVPRGDVRRLRLDMLLGLLWMFGTVLLAARLCFSSWLLYRLNRASTTAPDSVIELGRQLAKQCGIRRGVRFIVSRDLASSASPMTWGWMRPIILLPADTTEWHVDRLRPVLLHELGHIARLDWPALILADLAASIYWYHPFVWIMRRRLRLECEQACDDSVLARGLEPTAYASLLLDIARTNAHCKSAHILTNPLAIAMAQWSVTSSVLEKRVRSVMQAGKLRRPVTGLAAAGALLIMALLVSPLSAAQLIRSLPYMSAGLTGSSRTGSANDWSSSNLAAGGAYEQSSAPENTPDPIKYADSIAPTASGLSPLRSAPPSQNITGVSANGRLGDNQRIDLRDVRWGASKDGLQAGIQISGPSHSFASGRRIDFACYIRNASYSDIAFSFGNHWYMEQVPEVWNENNPATPLKMKVVSVFLTGEDPAFPIILKPGEIVSVVTPGLGLGEKQTPQPGSKKTGIETYPYLDGAAVGAYTLRQTVLYHLMTPAEVKQSTAKSRSKNATIIEPYALKVIGVDGFARDKQSAIIPIEQDPRPLTTASEHFDIVATEAANAPQPLGAANTGDIAWGKPDSGLQAGLRSPGQRRQFRIGDTVEMEYIVRNAGDKPITFEHDVMPGVEGVISDIIDSNGKSAYTIGLPVLHTSEMRQVTLEPGAMTVIGKTRMGLLLPRGSLNDLQGGSKASNWVEALPGKYQIRHLDTLYLKGDHYGKVTLYTGYLPLEIQPAAARTEAPIEANALKISWGKSINGLRAGLALQAAKVQIGNDIHTDLYINNTSKQDITINYIANDDKFFVPELWNAGGQHIKPDWTNPEVEQKIEGRSTLKPGESACIAHPFFGIATWRHNELAEANLFNQVGTFFVGGPGRYRVRMTAALMGAGTTWNYYSSGKVSFELVAK